MAMVFHLVGEQGSGKTLLGLAMMGQYAGRLRCVLVQEGPVYQVLGPHGDLDVLDENPTDLSAFDVVLREWQPELFGGGQPGETVIYIRKIEAPNPSPALANSAQGAMESVASQPLGA